MGNRSLDDFLGDSAGDGRDDDETAETDDRTEGVGAAEDRSGAERGGDEAERGSDGEADDGTGADVSVPTDEVDPAVSTYLGRAGECVACGATVKRRWESDAGPVCPECKEW